MTGRWVIPPVAQTAVELEKLRKTPPSRQIQHIMHSPYPADPVLEPELIGMTYFQVASLRQAEKAAKGSLDSLEFLLDRTVGKAIQHNTNVNIGGNYKDFLKSVKDKEEQFQREHPEIADAEIV